MKLRPLLLLQLLLLPLDTHATPLLLIACASVLTMPAPTALEGGERGLEAEAAAAVAYAAAAP